jgi:hypothetical protein
MLLVLNVEIVEGNQFVILTLCNESYADGPVQRRRVVDVDGI